MKNISTILIVLFVGVSIGVVATNWSSNPESGAMPDMATAEREILYWKAPMDPNYVRDTPGKSPMGMDLVPECPAASGTGVGRGARAGEVQIDPAIIQNMGMRTAAVTRRDMTRTVRAAEKL